MKLKWVSPWRVDTAAADVHTCTPSHGRPSINCTRHCHIAVRAHRLISSRAVTYQKEPPHHHPDRRPVPLILHRSDKHHLLMVSGKFDAVVGFDKLNILRSDCRKKEIDFKLIWSWETEACLSCVHVPTFGTASPRDDVAKTGPLNLRAGTRVWWIGQVRLMR